MWFTKIAGTLCALTLVVSMEIATLDARADIPPAVKWYELDNVSFDGRMFVLRDFDTVRGGRNVLCLHSTNHENLTWYNRFPFDTTNMFNWGSEFLSLQSGDFNGDGILDYCADGGSFFYVGLVNGAPPSQTPIFPIGIRDGGSSPVVGDFDGDGFEDVFIRGADSPTSQENFGRLMMGSKNLSKYIIVQIPCADSSASHYECVLDAFVDANSKMHVVTLGYDYYHSGPYYNQEMRLYEYRLMKNADSYTVHGSVTDIFPLDSQVNISYLAGSVQRLLHSRDHRRNAISFGWPEQDVYDLSNGVFQYLSAGNLPIETQYIPSIDKYTWFTEIGDLSKDTSIVQGVVCVGDPLLRSDTLMRFPAYTFIKPDTYIGSIVAAKVVDIGTDSHTAICAVLYGQNSLGSNGKSLVFYRTSDTNSVDVNTVDTASSPELLTLQPASIDCDLNIRILHCGNTEVTVRLFAMDGKLQGTLYRGFPSSQDEVVNIASNILPMRAGCYVIRLTNGLWSKDRLLIIY